MRILCIGDVCGSIGCRYLQSVLPALKREKNIDLCIVNGENSADGNGITPFSADSIYAAGADVITGGNHTFRRKEVFDKLDGDPFLLRPHNLRPDAPGSGYTEIDLGKYRAAVINLAGRVYMEKENASDPFAAADELVHRAEVSGIKNIIVDFHAEATSEKRALAEYLDGRISALFGTHTHVPTADAKVLPFGTGFVTDIGMTGPEDSVLGVKKELSIAKIKDCAPVRFQLADGKCILSGCLFVTDDSTGRTAGVEMISIKEQE